MSVPIYAAGRASIPSGGDRPEILQMNLAYNEMTVGPNGSVLSREEKAEIRFRHGYCRECEGTPVQLFMIKKSRLNPLWVTKEPRSARGECAEGVCFVCHPDRDPNRKPGRRRPNRDSDSSRKDDGPLSSGGSLKPAKSTRNVKTQPPDMNQAFDHSLAIVPSGNASANGSISSSDEPRHSMSQNNSSSSLPKVGTSPTDRLSVNTISPGTSHSHGSNRKKSRTPWTGVYVPEVMLEAANHSRNDDQMKAESPTPSISGGSNGGSNESLEGLESQHSQSSTRDPIMSASNCDLQTESSGTSDSSSSTSMLSPPQTSKPMVIQEELSPAPHTKAYSEIETTNIIDGINALVQGLADCGSPELLADILMGALREHRETPLVQTHCLSIIRDLCKDSPVNRSAMMSAGISEDLVRTLNTHTHDPVMLEHGCAIIWSLGVDDAYRISLIRAGACPSIVKAVKNFVATESLVRNAIGALRTLSPESEAREIFGGIGASKLVSEAMRVHRSSLVIQRDGCAFLSNCAVNIEKQIVMVVPFQELDAIVQALVHHRQEISVLQGACFALKNYTHEERNCRTLRKCKDVEELMLGVVQFARDATSADDASHILERMQMCRVMDESLEDEACSSLQRIMDSQDHALKTPGSILDFMRNYDWSARVTAFCLQALQQVVESPGGINDLFSNGMHQQVIPYCQTFSSNEDVCREACRFLISAADSSSHQQLLVDAGACQVLFNSLSVGRHDEKIACNALKALEILLPTKGCYEKFMENIGLVTEVVALHDTNESIQVLCSSIFSILDHQQQWDTNW